MSSPSFRPRPGGDELLVHARRVADPLARRGDRHLVVERDGAEQAHAFRHRRAQHRLAPFPDREDSGLDYLVEAGIAEIAAIALPEILLGTVAVEDEGERILRIARLRARGAVEDKRHLRF